MLWFLAFFVVGVIAVFRWGNTNFKKKAGENVQIVFEASSFRCEVDDTLDLSLTIKNNKAMFLPIILITITMDNSFDSNTKMDQIATKDTKVFTMVSSLHSYQQVVNHWQLTPSKRGYYEIECRISLVNFFNTVRKDINDIETVKLIVHPKAKELAKQEYAYAALQGDDFVKRYFCPDPLFYVGTRDYQPYDSFKDIDWRKSAQLQKLQVKNYEYTSQPEATILLLAEDNAGLNYENSAYVEKAVCLAASLAVAAHEKQASIQFGCNNYGRFHRMFKTAEFSHANIINILDELACATSQVKMKSEELMNLQVTNQNKAYIVITNRYWRKYDYFINKWLANNGKVHLFVYSSEGDEIPFNAVEVSQFE